MAPKRAPPPPPPPPPPVASSEETASGSGSEESEEEEIAHSPPRAAPRIMAPPPQKDLESEASDEDEDDEGEEDEEEEDGKANHVVPPPATKTLPPPPPSREESETSDEEEEEADDDMPQLKPAPNREAEAKGAKPSSSVEDKKPSALFQRTWSTGDEVRILEAMAAHRLEHGTLPKAEALADAIAGKLDNNGCSVSELQRKVKSLQSRYSAAVKKGALPSKDHDRRLFNLSKDIWVSTTKAPPKGGAGREVDEMCELYPFLEEEVEALQKAYPGLFKREFAMIDDSKARALDEKIKKQRHAQMKLHLRHQELAKEVTKTLMDLSE